MVNKCAGKVHACAGVVVGKSCQPIGNKTIAIVQDRQLETVQADLYGVIGHGGGEMIQPVEAGDRPVADVNGNAGGGCAVWYFGIRLDLAALIVVKFPTCDIADGKMRGIDGRKVAAQGLKDDQLETIVVRFAIGGYSIHMASIVPPFGEITMRCLILGETYGWQWSRCRCGIYYRQLGRR